MKKNRVLITGGLGYVGGRIAEALYQAGSEPVIGTRSRRLDPPSQLSHIEIVQTDYESAHSLEQACRGCDAVIHLAGMNEIDSESNFEGAFIANTFFTTRLIDAVHNERVPHFLYFSTAHVYGSPLIGVLTEASISQPAHPYSISHRAAEDCVLAGVGKKFQKGQVIRLSNSFGPPMIPEVNRWSLVVNDLCRQAATSGQLILKTPGTQVRDFITLTDVCRAVGWFLTKESTSEIFNLGGERTASIYEMAQLIAARYALIFEKELPIHRPAPSTAVQPLNLFYKIERLKASGFALTGDFESEIDALLRFCSKYFEIESRPH
jgi:UDP-glucose 4-epimerase